MNLIFSIMALVGGLLCCTGDILFDLKGPGNEKLGTSKNIDSNWSKMAEWRFKFSILSFETFNILYFIVGGLIIFGMELAKRKLRKFSELAWLFTDIWYI